MVTKTAKIQKTTRRVDFLEIMRESHLFASQKEARYALGAVCAAWRAWMIAMAKNAPEEISSRLTIPAVGAIRIGWYEKPDGQKRLWLRFTPTRKVRDSIRAQNKTAATKHAAMVQSVAGTETLQALEAMTNDETKVWPYTIGYDPALEGADQTVFTPVRRTAEAIAARCHGYRRILAEQWAEVDSGRLASAIVSSILEAYYQKALQAEGSTT